MSRDVRPLVNACSVGDVETLASLLKSHDSTRQGELIRKMFCDPDLDHVDHHLIFQRACRKAQIDLFQLYMADPQIPPEKRDSAAIAIACTVGAADVLKTLLQNPLDDLAKPKHLLESAICFDHPEIVEILINDPRVDLAVDEAGTKALGEAVGYGYTKIVERLLMDPRINPALPGQNEPIKTAAGNGHVAMIRVLLNDPRVNPTKATKYAWNTGLIFELFPDDRINRIFYQSFIFSKGVGLGPDISRCILAFMIRSRISELTDEMELQRDREYEMDKMRMDGIEPPKEWLED